jgi:hypothetical protein
MNTSEWGLIRKCDIQILKIVWKGQIYENEMSNKILLCLDIIHRFVFTKKSTTFRRLDSVSVSQLSRCHLKTETDSSLRNVVDFFSKKKTMDNVQTQENFISEPSSQTFKSNSEQFGSLGVNVIVSLYTACLETGVGKRPPHFSADRLSLSRVGSTSNLHIDSSPIHLCAVGSPKYWNVHKNCFILLIIIVWCSHQVAMNKAWLHQNT